METPRAALPAVSLFATRAALTAVAFCAVLFSAPTTAQAWEQALCFSSEVVNLDDATSVIQPAYRDAATHLSAPAVATTRCSRLTPVMTTGAERDDLASAQRAYRLAKELMSTNRYAEAALHFGVVGVHLPRLADHMSVFRADALFAAEHPTAALQAYREALESVDSTVRVLARVGRVRSLMKIGARDADEAFVGLMAKYPELPQAAALRLELAEMHDRRGEHEEAIAIYRRIDLREPGSPWAGDAREALDAMRSRGVAVRPLSPVQRVLRAEALAVQGPHDMAKDVIDALLAGGELRDTLKGRVLVAAARLARIEGRWRDAQRLLVEARAVGVPDEDAESIQNRIHDMATAAMSHERSEVERRLRVLRAGRPWGRVPNGALLQMIRLGSRVGMSAEVNRAIEAFLRRTSTFPGQRMNAALWSVGVARDEHIEALLQPLLDSPSRDTRLRARYHRARALHRLGMLTVAKEQYERVIRDDNGVTPFYRMWAEQHLTTLTEEWARCGSTGCDANAEQAGETTEPATGTEATGATGTTATEAADPDAPTYSEGLAEPGSIPATEREEPMSLAEAATRLHPIATANADALPWIGRAEDWLHLNERELAGEQLYEAFLGWRAARGRAIKRAGLESVCRGGERAGFAPDWVTRRERLELSPESRATLSEVADALDDFGASTGFGGRRAVVERPRAYARMVEAAAAAHGLDPNLLFAIMRVESVYQRRIVSYAGAIGLTQIMPRTGRHIARVLGNERFTTEELLDPATNLHYSAWYLKSLITRFDGHVPLAIASYNGGPHNVRRWLQDHSHAMPMEAFLEHIPFNQTHRYVRRVLTHYRAYRAQQELPMITLSTTLPRIESDPLAF